jgi:hypothetical protein
VTATRTATRRRHPQVTGVDKAKVIFGHIVEFTQSQVFYIGIGAGRGQDMGLALFIRVSITAVTIGTAQVFSSDLRMRLFDAVGLPFRIDRTMAG